MPLREGEPTLRDGPHTHVSHSCNGCRYLRSEHYTAQGDSGFDHDCTHGAWSSEPWRGYRAIGVSARTPEWCPFLRASGTTLEQHTKE